MAKIVSKNCCLLMAGLLIASLANQALGQGQIYFANRIASVDAKVFTADGVTPLAGLGYSAQLYGGPLGSSEAALIPIPGITTFRTGAGAGYFANPQTVTVPGVLPGERGTFQVRVWDNAVGAILSWEVATLKTASVVFSPPAGLGGLPADGSPPIITPELVGLMFPVSEPGVYALLALGLSAVMCKVRLKAGKDS